MMPAKDLARIALTGKATKYNKEKHVPLLIDVLSQMKGIESFCAEAGICKKTFHTWLHTYPEFKSAYDLGLPRGESVWANIPFSTKGRNVNVLAWRLSGQNRYGFGKMRLNFPANLAFSAKCIALQDALNEGNLDAQSYATIMSGYVAELKGKILDRSLTKEAGDTDVDILNMDENELVDYLLTKKT